MSVSTSASVTDDAFNFDEIQYGEIEGPRLWQRTAHVVAGWLKQIGKFFLSHLGLLAMVIIYAIIGAFIFVQLEQPNERNLCFINSENYNSIQASMLNRLQQVSSSYPQTSDGDDATEAFRALLNEFKDAVSGLYVCRVGLCYVMLQLP